MAKDKKPDTKRVVIYLDKEEHKKLRASLILKDRTVSDWVRIIIQDYLRKQEESLTV